MEIAFITSGLAPGQDGVGDYTRDLAAACIQRGHSCRIIGLNDRGVLDTVRQEQTARGVRVDALRIAATTSWPQRLQRTLEFLEWGSVEWVSLQFVPYGYDRKGLIGAFGARLAPVVAGRRLQLMFHELWIGAEQGASLPHRLIGFAQRRAIIAMVESLAPSAIHTSNETYRALLREQGVQSTLLPLCGSIPVVSPPDGRWLEIEARRVGVAPAPHRSWWFGLFGSLHPVWSPEPLFSHLAEAAQRSGRHVVIASIGRQGPGEELWRELEVRYSGRFTFVKFGECSPRDVSLFLQGIDFGIATTPWSLIGKSATVAAMLEHGLPVIVSRDDVHFGCEKRWPSETEPLHQPLLYKMDSNLPEWLVRGAVRGTARDGLDARAEQFLADMTRFPLPSNCNSRRFKLT